MTDNNYVKLFVRTPVGTMQKLFSFDDRSQTSARKALVEAQSERTRLGEGQLSVFKRTKHIRGVPEIGAAQGASLRLARQASKHIGMPRTGT